MHQPRDSGYDRSRERYRCRDRDRDLSTVLVDATCAMGALELQLEAAGDGFMHLVYGLNYGAVRRRSRASGLRPGRAACRACATHRTDRGTAGPHRKKLILLLSTSLNVNTTETACTYVCAVPCAHAVARTSGAETAHTPDRTERRGRAPGTSRGLATLRLSAVSQTIPPHASRCARGHPPTTGTARTDRSAPRRPLNNSSVARDHNSPLA